MSRTSPPALSLTVAKLVALCVATGSALAQDRPLDGDFPEVYRVGGLTAPPWAQFDNPSRMGFDGVGNLYLLDRGTMQVVVVDRSGGLVATIGRQGDGPGEFQGPTDLVVWRDGRFAVADPMRGAYQLFGPDRTLEGSIRMSSTSGLASMAAARKTVRADPQGNALIAEGPGMAAQVSSIYPDRMGVEQLGAVGENGKLERLHLNGEFAVANPIVSARYIPPADPEGDRPYFAPEVIWDVLPDGTIGYFDSTTYAVNLVGADGSTKWVFERALHPETVTPSTRAAVVEHLLEVQARRSAEEPWDDLGPIDVVGPDRQYRGTFATGDPMPMAFGPEGLVAYLERNELDVPIIVVKRLSAEVR